MRLNQITHKTNSDERKELIKEIDRMFNADICRLGYCEYSRFTNIKTKGRLAAHHFYSCSRMSTRWDVDNMFCLADEFHTKSTQFSAHGTPEKFRIWAIAYRGKDWFQRLSAKADTIKQWTNLELIELYEGFQKIESKRKQAKEYDIKHLEKFLSNLNKKS